MATDRTSSWNETASEILKAAMSDVQGAIERRFAGIRQDIREDAKEAVQAALSMGTGTGLVLFGGILGSFGAAHLLQRITGLPLWTCLGLVGGGLGAVGTQMLRSGASQARELMPSEAVDVVRESVGSMPQTVTSR